MNPKPSLADTITSIKQPRKRTEPLWKGPEVDGVTFSLLSRYLACKERARLLLIEGLKQADGFNHRIEYGNFWHLCEEAHSRGVNPLHREPIYPGSDEQTWGELLSYAQGLTSRYPLAQEQIEHWYMVCRTQFPVYLDYWSTHKDEVDQTSLLSERVFDIPYKLPSGRLVKLRGKWDSVDLVKGQDGKGIWLQENKTKGDIDGPQMVKQLTFDLQTMLYLTALVHSEEIGSMPGSLRGVRYNVIRRPLSGGVHSIRQHKPSKSNPAGETKEEFYARLGGLIRGEPELFFMRWNVAVGLDDIALFKWTCFDPVLENICDDYEWWSYCKTKSIDPFTDPPVEAEGLLKTRHEFFPFHYPRHFRFPYGIYNPLAEGKSSELDEHLLNGSELGLTRTENLFPELEV